MYLNVRGVNSKAKQELLNKFVQSHKPDILALSETKLTRYLQIEGYHHMQTRKVRSGGCWAGSKFDRVKKIKALGSSICWISPAYQFVPLHIFCCYLQPNNKPSTDQTFARLKHAVQGVLSRIPSSRIVIVGDFNERIQEISDWAMKVGLTP